MKMIHSLKRSFEMELLEGFSREYFISITQGLPALNCSDMRLTSDSGSKLSF